ncbi:sigma-54-dependent transcriptional regulator [Phenylobacterium sp.]|uniref:sigma-54-dependent transcriptional regulator n=1 Tax=Phenylobacterium sp. TaxID=1871053 RepID=UPI002E34609C|nr:response regulator [Phenylobacterium sp.]HEX4711583.1 response regulator [Phenylobacterium sp.]
MAEDLSSDLGVVLFVDDDADVLASAEVLLGRNGYRMAAARTPTEAWSVLATETIDVILLDLNFTPRATSGAEGFQWLSEIRARDPDAVVVVVTGHSGINVAVQAMKAGAADFVMKPWNNARFLETLGAAHAVRRQRRRAGGGEPAATEDVPPIVGESAAIQRVRGLIDRAAATHASMLIHGEPGSGKTLAARTIHARSARAAGPLVTVDGRSLSDGAARPTLNQAVADAAGGTLVLDEIGDLPPAVQSALLAALEAGGDTRLVSTMTGGRDAVAGMRGDLLARLSTVEVFLPPLAERGADAALLLQHFVRLFSHRYGREPKALDASALEGLQMRPPSGEVRGLRQAAERAVVLSQGVRLTAADFAPTAAPDPAAPSGGDLNLARSEKAAVEAALKRHAHNISQAARELGLTRAALYRRMVKHGL